MHDGQKTWLFWPLIIHLVVDDFMWKLNRSINVYLGGKLIGGLKTGKIKTVYYPSEILRVAVLSRG